jgi:hypothetical protein
MTMPDDAVWEDIKRAYETSPETVLEIAARFDIAARKISGRATSHNWIKRPRGTDSLMIARAKRAAGITSIAPDLSTTASRRGVPAGGTLTHKKAIVRRLYDVTDAKIAAIEQRIAAKTALTGTDADREGREITVILKTIEKLMDLADALTPPAAKSNAAPGTAASALADDADRLRRDLAQRFARLCDSANPDAFSSATSAD